MFWSTSSRNWKKNMHKLCFSQKEWWEDESLVILVCFKTLQLKLIWTLWMPCHCFWPKVSLFWKKNAGKIELSQWMTKSCYVKFCLLNFFSSFVNVRCIVSHQAYYRQRTWLSKCQVTLSLLTDINQKQLDLWQFYITP